MTLRLGIEKPSIIEQYKNQNHSSRLKLSNKSFIVIVNILNLGLTYDLSILLIF